jgi:hypothetical protein
MKKVKIFNDNPCAPSVFTSFGFKAFLALVILLMIGAKFPEIIAFFHK